MQWNEKVIDGKKVWGCDDSYWKFTIEKAENNCYILWSNCNSRKYMSQSETIPELFYTAYDLELKAQRIFKVLKNKDK